VSGVRVPRTPLLISLAAGLALVSTTSSRAALPSLYFHYAADCTFQLVDDGGNQITTIPPGAYQVVIDTPFSFATNPASCPFVKFDLAGPGVSVQTTLGDGGSEIEQYPVTLRPSSTYVAQDDGSPARTRKTFSTAASGSPAPVTTTTGGPTTTTPPGSPKTPTPVPAKTGNVVQRGALVGTVAANGTLSLTRDGKPVKILLTGRYTLTVRDRSRSSGFTLQAARSDPITLTPGPFVGTRSKTLTLGRGQWLFYGSFTGKKTYFLVTG
jgi:hypothetical protein